jgi:hypothetical protein
MIAATVSGTPWQTRIKAILRGNQPLRWCLRLIIDLTLDLTITLLMRQPIPQPKRLVRCPALRRAEAAATA